MKSVELFAGAGGLAIAGANAGLHHEAVVEWNSNACATMRLNQHSAGSFLGKTEIIEGDVCKEDFTSFHGGVDLVSGGPPCQPFSIGGKHRANLDDRDMFPQAVRAVREIQPAVFVFENVKGLLRDKFSNYFSYCRLQLSYPNFKRRGDEDWEHHLARLEQHHTKGPKKGLRYQVVYQLLNAADYGVPQKRERVFIVGVRSDLGLSFSFPAPTHSQDRLLYDQWVSGDYWTEHGLKKPAVPPKNLKNRIARLAEEFPEYMPPRWNTVRDAICDLPKLRAGQTCLKVPNHFFNPGAKSYPGHTGSPYDLPAKTLKAGDHGVPGGENMLRKDDGSVRYFSVRECARLQTFPDDWVLEGSWTESMRQLGNAVPVKLAQIVIARLVNILKSESKLSC